MVGELSINRDGLSLQNEQLQRSLRELLNRFARFQKQVGNLHEVADQSMIAPERHQLRLLEATLAKKRDGW